MEKIQERQFTSEIFSDSIFLLDPKKGKIRLALVLTKYRLFAFRIENWKLHYRTDLDRIDKIIIASESCAFICLQIKKESGGVDELVIESFRRVEIIAYIAEIFKDRDIPMFKVTASRTIEIKAKESPKLTVSTPSSTKSPKDGAPLTPTLQADKKSKKSSENQFMQEAIRNSKKSGFMRKVRKGVFGQVSTDEYFFVLSDIGLIYFRKYGDLKTAAFLPVLGGEVSKVPKSTFGKDWIISIKTSDMEKHLQCYSELEMEDWIKNIKNMQTQAIGVKDTIKEMKKVL